MNSFERVKAAIHFDNPDRVPVMKMGGDIFTLWMMPPKEWQPGHNKGEEGLFPHVDDFIIRNGLWEWKRPDWAKNPKYPQDNGWLDIKREEIDEWGCIWIRQGGNKTMGHPGRPSLPDWAKYEEYIEKYSPNPDIKERYSFSTKYSQRKKILDKNVYRLCTFGLGPAEHGSMMRGFNNYLVDHVKHPEELKRLLEHFIDHYVKIIRNWKRFGADPHGFLLVQDFGEQTGPFFSPKTFKKFYEPFYRAVCDEAHNMNCDIIQHCCGKVDRLLPLLIEWGLDAIEFDSPRMSGYPDLSPYRGKISMWGCVNIQSIYPQGIPEECEREVWHMIRNLGTKNGGFVAYFYPQPHHIKTPQENIEGFSKGLEKYGDYSKIPSKWWDYPVMEEWKDNIVPPLPPI